MSRDDEKVLLSQGANEIVGYCEALAQKLRLMLEGSPRKVEGSCWIPGSYTPYTGLNHLILNGFFQRCHIGHDPRAEPVKTTS